MGGRAFAEPGIVVLTAKELDVMIALVEVEVEIAAALRAFQICLLYTSDAADEL